MGVALAPLAHYSSCYSLIGLAHVPEIVTCKYCQGTYALQTQLHVLLGQEPKQEENTATPKNLHFGPKKKEKKKGSWIFIFFLQEHLNLWLWLEKERKKRNQGWNLYYRGRVHFTSGDGRIFPLKSVQTLIGSRSNQQLLEWNPTLCFLGPPPDSARKSVLWLPFLNWWKISTCQFLDAIFWEDSIVTILVIFFYWIYRNWISEVWFFFSWSTKVWTFFLVNTFLVVFSSTQRRELQADSMVFNFGLGQIVSAKEIASPTDLIRAMRCADWFTQSHCVFHFFKIFL